MFNLKVYFSIAVGLVATRYLVTHKILIVLLSLGMLPQIAQIAVKNINNKLDFYFGIVFLNVRGLLLVNSQ